MRSFTILPDICGWMVLSLVIGVLFIADPTQAASTTTKSTFHVRTEQFLRSGAELRSNAKFAVSTTSSSTASMKIRDAVQRKIEHARTKANAATAAELRSLKATRERDSAEAQNLSKQLGQKRALLRSSKNVTNTDRKQAENDISTLEKQSTDLVARSKQRFSTLANLNSKLKQQFEQNLSFSEEEKKNVTYVEPDYLYAQDDTIPVFPSDTELQDQWYLGRIISQYPDIFASVSQIDHPILVAVIDSGVDYTNPELTPHMWSAALCADENGTPIDGGCVNGYDFVQNDSIPLPTDGSDHGTAVASLIGAVTNNGTGMASLSHNRAHIMALRVADSGYVQESALIRAIYFAVNNNAQVINLSLSGPTYSQALYDALAFAQSQGGIIVTSAGNLGQNIDQNPVYPASYALPNIIPVGALSPSGSLSSYSNYGASTVKAAAPGDLIWAASLNNSFSNHSGTSFAAPIITSYIARNLSLNISATSTIQNLPTTSGLDGFVSGGKGLGFLTVATTTPQPIETALYQDSTGGWVNPQSKGGEYVDPATFVASTTYQLDAVPAVPVPTYPGSVSSPGSALYNTTGQYMYWYASSGATNYGVYIRDLTTNTLILDNDYAGNTTISPIPTLIPGHSYRWNMRAQNASGWSAFSPAMYFYVPSLSAPSGLTPGSTGSPGPTLSGTATTFSWGSVSNATYYYLAYTDLNTNAPYGGSVSGTSYAASNLIPGHRYSWYVQACTSSVCSARSPDYYFTVEAVNHPPAMPAMSDVSSVQANATYNLTLTSSDLDNDNIEYTINWGDGSSQFYGYYNPGYGITFSHVYTTAGSYTVTARAYDGRAYSSTNSRTLTVTSAPASTLDLIPIALSLDSSSRLPGQTIGSTITVKNQGSLTLNTPFTISYYLAPQAAGLSTTYPLGTYSWTSSIAAGAQGTHFTTFTLPNYGESVYSQAGTYNVIAVIDSANAISESNESNNRPSQYGVDYSQFTVQSVNNGTGSTPSITMTLSTTSPTVGESVTATITTQNIPIGTTINLTSTGLTGVTPSNIVLTSSTWSDLIKFNSAGSQNVTVSASGSSFTVPNVRVTGGSLTSGAVALRFTDASGHTPVENVFVRVDPMVSTAWTGSTDPDGRVVIPRGTFPLIDTFSLLHVTATYTDHNLQSQTENITLNLNNLDVKRDLPIHLSVDLTHVPVILVPGIMGSTDGRSFSAWYASLPATFPARASDLKLLDTGNLVGWNTLEADLVAQGYQKGKTIIECPYDWRARILDGAYWYLKECVQKAIDPNLNPQANGKVDIIAHSQGGLVTRAYIQNNTANAQKVRKIAFIGTPQYGATGAYYAWEGGDMDDMPTITPSSYLRSKSDTTRNVYSAMRGQELPSTSAVSNTSVISCASLPVLMQAACAATYYLTDYLTYRNDAHIVKDFVHQSVPSIKQLLPIYDFLKFGANPATSINSLENDNEFLKALNGKTCNDGDCENSFTAFNSAAQNISMKFFYDNSATPDTEKEMRVQASSDPALYEDGMPLSNVAKLKTSGDETVPADSIEYFLNDAGRSTLEREGTASTGKNYGHALLIGKMRAQILSFITGTQLSSISLSDTVPTLYVSIKGPVQVLLTDSTGHQKGLDQNGIAYDTIAGATAQIEGGNNEFTIPNPLSGAYILSLSGATAGTVTINIGYNSGVDGAITEFTEMKLYHNIGAQTFTFTAQP